jgi:aspartyl-tRNA(Asn)/glutamyl-tRNA(Gln) amidotransferase subunit B
MHAIEIEALRQIEIIEGGGSIIQETRLFDPEMDETRSMRSKEDATDYRYFPDPDLLPIELDDEYINRIKETLPELAEQKISRYVNDYGLSTYDAEVLTAEKDVAIYFDKVVSLGADPKISSNWIISELFGYLNKASMDLLIQELRPSIWRNL